MVLLFSFFCPVINGNCFVLHEYFSSMKKRQPKNINVWANDYDKAESSSISVLSTNIIVWLFNSDRTIFNDSTQQYHRKFFVVGFFSGRFAIIVDHFWLSQPTVQCKKMLELNSILGIRFGFYSTIYRNEIFETQKIKSPTKQK